jgi:hypothetical protein
MTDKDEEEKGTTHDNPKLKYLLKHLIADLQQLTYAGKMQEILPKEMHELIYQQATNFKYSSPEEVGYADSQIILDRIKEKATSEQLWTFINSPSTQIESSGEILFDIILRSIFSLAQ